ncbi:MAG: restriction endonuclease subunit S [Clostridiales bacterium]|nr:restriction endonuclease subunit S [Clostridiales bacterium]
MNKINTVNWKRFHLYDECLFDIDSGNKFDKSKMTMKNPSINFVGRSTVNNGITCFVDKYNEIEPYKAGYMTVALGGEYLGSCFIQNDCFYTSQNVDVLIPKWEMPYYVKKFISIVIFRESRTYYKAFEDELNRHMLTDFSILLPQDNIGKPDWEYMQNYMDIINERASNRIKTLSNIKGNRTKIDISHFAEFPIGELFEINPTNSYDMTNKDLLDGGENPVVTNSKLNNGISGYSSQEPTEKGNMITFSDTTDANSIFYQEDDFIGYSHIQGLYPIGEYKDKWSKYSLMYFSVMFKQKALCMGFNYDIKFRRDKAINIKIPLPVKDEKIDFEYMENYMRNIEEKSYNRINYLKNFSY